MSFAVTSELRPVADTFDPFVEPGQVLLAVWAHPDDESLLAAGLMAQVARSGGRVVSVCATLGEHGTSDPDLWPPAVLAAERERELRRALGVIGADELTLLGYEDGSCEHVPDALGARHVGSIIDRVRPDVVVGFGPDGVTGHPDHRAVARWTALALAERGSRTPLITSAAGAAWPAPCIERMDEIDAFWPGYPHRGVDRAVGVRLDEQLLELKLEALACHRSQFGPLQQVLGPADYRRLASIEAYRAANAPALSTIYGMSEPIAA